MAEMTPIDWAKRPLQKFADFAGRAPRAEYWWFFLATIIAYFVVMIVESIVGLDATVGPYGPLSVLLMLALLVPSLAVTLRRLHDTDRTGWWILIAVVPYFIVGVMAGAAAAGGSTGGLAAAGLLGLVALAGAIVLLVFMVLPGTKGDNRYGPDPYASDTGAVARV
jgi:uncharacterized membrane protein YhaH (DUF805 family)